MANLDFYIVDVFAERKYRGNQLAVFLDANKIDEKMMLQIAKEINFAETTFVLGGNETTGFDVKIFTPESEIPFAGHPTVGTSYVIKNFLLKNEIGSLTLNLKVGKVMADFTIAEDGKLFTFITQIQPEFNDSFTKNEIAMLLNINASEIDDQLPIIEISTGLPFIIVPIKSLESIKEIKIDADSFSNFMRNKGLYKTNNSSGLTTSIFCFTPETYEKRSDFNSRMFCVEDEILKEDAATGSANGCFLAYYLKYISPKADISMEQGFEMGRPSHLKLKGSFSENHYEIKVGGSVQLVAKGEWFV
jgi:trans-2,3-dihydro-3-hydroxyanthranilate isomerase